MFYPLRFVKATGRNHSAGRSENIILSLCMYRCPFKLFCKDWHLQYTPLWSKAVWLVWAACELRQPGVAFSPLPAPLVPPVMNPCTAMSCDFLCLLNPTGASCSCPEGKALINGSCTDKAASGGLPSPSPTSSVTLSPPRPQRGLFSSSHPALTHLAFLHPVITPVSRLIYLLGIYTQVP